MVDPPPPPHPHRISLIGALYNLETSVQDLITGTQNFAFCQKKGIQPEITHNKF